MHTYVCNQQEEEVSQHVLREPRPAPSTLAFPQLNVDVEISDNQDLIANNAPASPYERSSDLAHVLHLEQVSMRDICSLQMSNYIYIYTHTHTRIHCVHVDILESDRLSVCMHADTAAK
jgi:hypothetical protein